MIKTQRGGKREGAGRPTKHGAAMIQKTVRLPEAWITDLVTKFGSFQVAIETIVENNRSET